MYLTEEGHNTSDMHACMHTYMLLRGTQQDYKRAERPEHKQLCLSEKHHDTKHTNAAEVLKATMDVLNTQSTDNCVPG